MTTRHVLRAAAGMGLAAFLLTTVASSTARVVSTQAPEPRVIEVTVKRFEFEPARIEVTEGETVRLVVSSADGVHGFGVKKFKISKKIPRGEQVTIEFSPTAVGEFEILCTEYCGKGHEDMKATLVVVARPAQ